MLPSSRPFLKSLEGIRAYAFMMVFAVHFSGFKWTLIGRSYATYPWLLFIQLSFVAIPIFFALSGYLITGILFDTQFRTGYFRVFYLRRAFRVLPLYYAIVFVSIALAISTGGHLERFHLLYLVYLSNWSADPHSIIWSKYIHVSHLWSMAVEEQFYLIWPVIIWTLRDRIGLLKFCYAAVVITFVFRLAFPLFHMSVFQVYQSTFFRGDALMLGAALALHERGPMKSLAKLAAPAWIVVVLGIGVISGRAIAVGEAVPSDAVGIAFILPLLSLIGASLVVLAIQPDNVISYACELPWAVALGRLSYSLYILHYLLVPVWEDRVIPKLSRHLGEGLGRATGLVAAFSIVYAVGLLSYQYIEVPGMRRKNRYQYGSDQSWRSNRGVFAFFARLAE